jgi:diguanylate cyclase (GGDEF)-like protein
VAGREKIVTTDSKMNWRFRRMILVPMAVATAAAIALAVFGLYWATSSSDAVSVERQAQTTRRAIDDIVARLALEQETVAVWDDTVTHLQQRRRDLGWINDNTGDWLHRIFGHDVTFILDGRDNAVYGYLEGRMIPSDRFQAMRADLQPMIDDARGRRHRPNNRFDRHPGTSRPGSAALTTARAVHDTKMIRIEGRPAAASVMLIRASTPSLQPAGPEPVMISIRFLDRGFLRELEDRNLIEAPRFSNSDDPAPGEQSIKLGGEDGAAVAYFIWRPALPGTRILGVLGPITAALIAAMIGLMALLARWLRRSTGQLKETLVQLKASEAQAQHLAFHDTLTGLPNRALFNDRLDHALARTRRGEALAVLTLDLDRFKNVNDTLGHLAGDALIREFGTRVNALVREGDTVARLGGDEFAVLLPDLENRRNVEALCARILAAVHQPFEVLGNAAFVGVSIGVVHAPECGLDRTELMRKADIALYRAKAEGRDCYRLFTDSMDERIRFRSEIEEDLRAALASGDQLRVHYQPQMGPDGDQIVGLEALVRWEHPKLGLVSPEQFVPVAEETGLICQLGEWVLGEACKVARRWPKLFVAVNL